MTTDGGLRLIFQKHLPDFHWQGIETSIARGIPDANYCCHGIDGWMEFKKTDHWKVNISPEQIGWCERRRRAGGRVFVAVRQMRLRHLYLFDGSRTKELALGSLKTVTSLGCWDGLPGAWDWDAIRAILLASNNGSNNNVGDSCYISGS